MVGPIDFNGVSLVASMSFDNPLPNQTDNTQEGMDIVGFLNRRKSFIILFALLGIGVGYLLFNREVPLYRSDALVQVIHRNSDPRLRSMIAEKDLTDADFVIKAPRTLEAAIRNHQLSQLSLFRGLKEDEAVHRLSGMITTKSLSANVVQVSVSGTEPDEIRQCAQAISEEYVKSQRENYKDASEELRKLLGEARTEFLDKLNAAERAYSEFREKSELTTDGQNPFRQRAIAAESKVSELELQKTERLAQLNQIEEALKSNGSREAILLLVTKQSPESRIEKNGVATVGSASQNMGTTLLPLLIEEASLAARLGADHPELKLIRMRIEMTRKHMQELAGLKPEENTEEQPKDFLTIYLDSLRQELLIIERQQSNFRKLADDEDAMARKLMQQEIEDTNRKNEMDRLSKLFNETTMQISEIQVTAGMGGVTAQVLTGARHGALVYPLLPTFIGMGGFLGGIAGLILGYLVEIADRSFRKPEEIIREFGVPIIGHIPFMTDQKLKNVPEESAFDRTAISVHLPRSRPAEAYRAVRTALCFSAFGSELRVISVTSPAAGDGKSTLALNLALSLAQSGKRTILIEGDLRRPKVHKLTGVKNKEGVVEVLRGEAELENAIQPTSIGDFFVLPCGQRPKDPAELLARPFFKELLEKLREQFEYVIVDSPPVLAVTDPCGIAARVDGTVVCMRLSRHTRDLGRRTLEQLRDVGATVTGVVINGVEERDAYGYGNYRYSDYQYYYKNYNYKYGDGKYGSGQEYYADEHVAEPAFSVGESKEEKA